MRYDLVTNHWWTGMIKIYIKKKQHKSTGLTLLATYTKPNESSENLQWPDKNSIFKNLINDSPALKPKKSKYSTEPIFLPYGKKTSKL